MTQDELPFNGRPPFVQGSDTSEAAAESMATRASAVRWAVLAVLTSYPMTCDEVEVVLVMRHQTASARIRELFLMGKIVEDGKRKTRSGRMAVVWKVAP